MVHQSRGSKFWQRSVANREDHSCSSVTGISSKDGLSVGSPIYTTLAGLHCHRGGRNSTSMGTRGLGRASLSVALLPRSASSGNFSKEKDLSAMLLSEPPQKMARWEVAALPGDGPFTGASLTKRTEPAQMHPLLQNICSSLGQYLATLLAKRTRAAEMPVHAQCHARNRASSRTSEALHAGWL